MKTFDEAVNATLMCRASIDAPEDALKEQLSEITAVQAKYHQTLEEIQSSPESINFAIFLMSHLPDEIPMVMRLVIALSHGVMIGMEMEKPDPGEGRCPCCGALRTPPGRTLKSRIAAFFRMRPKQK